MSCPHGEWHEEDCEICQQTREMGDFEHEAYEEGFRAGCNQGKANTERTRERLELLGIIAEVESERDELRKAIRNLSGRYNELSVENERLKCCGNCDWYSSSLYDCNDDVDDELDDLAAGCDCYDSCHFTPSRWSTR